MIKNKNYTQLNSGDTPNIQEGGMIARVISVFRVWQLYKNPSLLGLNLGDKK